MTLVQSEPKKIYMGSTEIKKVYLGSTQIRPAGGGGWQPGANTLAYYPLNSTYTNTDQSGNNNNGTTVGTLTYSNNYCQFTSGNYINIPKIIPYGTNPFTISVWYNTSDNSGHQNAIYCQGTSGSNTNTSISAFIYQTKLWFWANQYPEDWMDILVLSSNTWYNIIFTYTGDTEYCYINGISQGTHSRTISSTTPTMASIGRTVNNEYCIGKISNLIIEDRVRTAQEISDYYNQTKGDYGIVNLQNITPNISPNVIPDTPNNGTGDVLTI